MPIALLTDFGTRDHYVAAMKGVILTIDPQAVIVDITHETKPQDIRSAAFTLLACYRDFPAETTFVVVVDPGVGSIRRGIAGSNGGYNFVGPDNGVLGFAFGSNVEIVELTNRDYFARNVSPTFHGRDIFAPVAAHLSTGVPLKDLGRRIIDPVLIEFPQPRINKDGSISGEIIHIDYFGNLITNLKQSDLPERFRIEIAGRQIAKYCKFFAESEPGELVSIIGSTEFLEIVVNRGSAEAFINVKTGQTLHLTPEN